MKLKCYRNKKLVRKGGTLALCVALSLMAATVGHAAGITLTNDNFKLETNPIEPLGMALTEGVNVNTFNQSNSKVNYNIIAGDINVPGGNIAGDINVPGGSIAGDINVPGGSIAGDINVPGGSIAGDINVPGGSIVCDTINIYGSGLQDYNVKDFNVLNFYIPNFVVNGDTLVTLTGPDELDLNGKTINVGVMEGSGLRINDTVTLIDASNGGITKDGSIEFGQLNESSYRVNGLSADYEFTTTVSEDSKKLITTVDLAPYSVYDPTVPRGITLTNDNFKLETNPIEPLGIAVTKDSDNFIYILGSHKGNAFYVNGFDKLSADGDKYSIIGGYDVKHAQDSEDVSGNTVIIANSAKVNQVYGGYTRSEDGNAGSASGNALYVESGSTVGDIYGGFSYSGNAGTGTRTGGASNNIITIKTGSTLTGGIAGGYAQGADNGGNTNGNRVVIEEGVTINSSLSVVGGYNTGGDVDSQNMKSNGNLVDFASNVSSVVGGYGVSSANNNKVNIRANADMVIGGLAYGESNNNTINWYKGTVGSIMGGQAVGDTSGNVLNVYGSGLETASIMNFNVYNFVIDKDVLAGATLVTVDDKDTGDENKTYLSNTAINVGVMAGSGLRVNNQVVLLENADGIVAEGATYGQLKDSYEFKVQGLSTDYVFDTVLTDNDTKLTTTVSVYNDPSSGDDSGDTGSGDDSGDTGSGGDSGDTGSGDSGDTGSGGDSGDTGSGDDSGDTGSGGDSGDTGSGGDSGDTGSGGDTGDTGSGGDSGDTGSGGDSGDTGSGDSGDTGSGGDSGDTGSGNQKPTQPSNLLKKESKSLVETQVLSVANINSSIDMMMGKGMEAATMAAADIASVDQDASNKGFAPFAYAGTEKMKYKTGSHVDANGYNLGVGFAREVQNNAGKLVFGPVVHYGRASYDSYLDTGVHGEGKATEIGLSVLAKQDNHDGVYYEGSIGFGRVTSDYKNNDYYSFYDTKSNYYAAHLGVGKLQKFGEQASVEYYTKLMYSHQNASNATVHSAILEDFKFDAVNSVRTRLGARVENAYSALGRYYYGLAWEYEFAGDARATYIAIGKHTPSPSLQGSSGMAEIGWKIKPSAGSNLSADLGLQGWFGKKQGVGVNAMLNWSF